MTDHVSERIEGLRSALLPVMEMRIGRITRPSRIGREITWHEEGAILNMRKGG